MSHKLNDTIQNIHMLDENFPNKSLDVVATSFTELKGHKHQFTKLINEYVKTHKRTKEPIRLARSRLWGKAYKSIPLSIRIKYGCGDADATGRLRRRFRKQLKLDNIIPLHNLMMETTKLFVDIECNGIKVNEKLIPELDKEYRNQIYGLEESLQELSGKIMNHKGPLQVRQLLYGDWKLSPHEIRMGKKRVRYSTGKHALELLLKDDLEDIQRSYIKNLLEYRKVTKLHGTYIEGLPRFLRDGFIHATWNLIGADTGRSSCNDPNLQQVPRTGPIKGLFISRYKHGVLMQIDVKQGEPRLAAHISNEPTLIKIFNNDKEDIYRSIAAEVLHKQVGEITEEERYKCKQT